MRSFVWLVGVGVSLLLAAACQARQPQPEYRPTATIKDIMDSTVDPSADVLWESVATIVSAAGTEERMPRTDEEWENVGNSAAALIESGNLLLMDGRAIDKGDWVKMSQAMIDAGKVTLQATQAKSTEGVLAAGEVVNESCDNCHQKYQRGS